MINIIGLGYIGLPTALILAANGEKVTGTDYSNEIIDKLNNDQLTFKEKGLEELFFRAKEQGILFTNNYKKSDIYIIAVPTPYRKDDKKIDTTCIVSAVKSVMKVCEEGAIIIIESTVSPGTIDRVIRPLFNDYKYELGKSIHLVHAPERILPGNMIHELENNSRTIGADNIKIAEIVKKIYSTFCKGEITLTDIRSAEMSKVIENTFRDINIAFANELVNICRKDSLDVYEIIYVANKHPRVNILSPGPGVGGHCIPVDPWFLVGDFPRYTKLITSAREINDSMPEYVLNRIYDIMEEKGISDTKRVGLYGLTYKANVDDIRESPTLQLIDIMKRHLAKPLKVYDPMVTKKLIDSQIMEFNEFIKDIDMVVIMVSHKHIKNSINSFKEKIVFDTQNVIEGAYRL
ncbi:MAG: nucleotide sugar dehydrogenase [Lactobacillales bacterium]|jgi:UDP-N-acetyl-D-mannosaminuronic acid dehydrogenase|nr:nucleotide sugar dehydrogenase [Lactobacillales bacterium]